MLVVTAVHFAVYTSRAIPTYALYFAMKNRMQLWLERPFSNEHAVVDIGPRALNPVVWGKEVLPCVLDALYACEGSGYRCRALQEFQHFLRPEVVYNALSKVLKISMLPLDGRSPRIACFKVLRRFVRQYSSAMPVYVQDWLQMASHTVQYALTELFPATGP